MNLGDKLRTLRLRTKKTLREQSKILNVSMNSIYRWEHNLSVPRKPVLQRMADYYEVPFEWLISDDSSASLVSEVELDLLGMFRRLPDKNRFKVIGYVERMSVEDVFAEEFLY